MTEGETHNRSNEERPAPTIRLFGREIALPIHAADRPAPELLTWHNENVFERRVA